MYEVLANTAVTVPIGMLRNAITGLNDTTTTPTVALKWGSAAASAPAASPGQDAGNRWSILIAANECNVTDGTLGLLEITATDCEPVTIELKAVVAGYTARVEFTRVVDHDAYTVRWYRNNVVIGHGEITSPTIAVCARSSGDQLVAPTSLIEVGSTGVWKYNEATNRLAIGDVAIVDIAATIDGATRTWSWSAGRDS